MPIQESTLKKQVVSIVVLGSLNPSIFHPAWFLMNGLINEEESNAAELGIVHKGISEFSTSWFKIQVLDDRLTLSTGDASRYHPLRDLVLGAFQILEHTPVSAVGLNSHRDYEYTSREKWNAFGDRFAPKDGWSGILDNPGLRLLTMEGFREEAEDARIQVRLEPSREFDPGIRVNINEHYDLMTDEKDSQKAMRKLLERLGERWDGFLSYCDCVGNQLW